MQMAPIFLSLLLVLFCPAILLSGQDHEIIDLGTWSRESMEMAISQSRKAPSVGEQVESLSRLFLETPYQAGTMVGASDQPEALVIRFDAVDCFTLLDYVEALRRAESFVDFKRRLVQVRYKQGQVDFLDRNHFFTDWGRSNSDHIAFVTSQVGGDSIRLTDKMLNLRADGSLFIQGYQAVSRRFAYIPAESLNQAILQRLQAGDYVGIYSPLAGLDVSHTGIIVKHQGKTILRHASSLSSVRKVVDVELASYLKARTGLVVLRPH